MNSEAPRTASVLLADARRLRAEADLAEAAILIRAVEWASLHETVDPDLCATWADSPVPIAGPGAPLVREFCIAEFGAALGLSPDAGRALIAHAVELAHRLPRTWQRVTTGTLATWKARRIAESTLGLSPDGAAFVDRQVAFTAHKVGPAQVQRLVDEAIARFDPELAEEQRRSAADRRHVTIDHRQVSFDGTCQVSGELDLPDAQDLDEAIAAGAARLQALGCTEPLDVRRALAVGELARREPALDLGDGSAAEAGSSTESTTTRTERTRGRRDVVLYVHLSENAIRTGSGIGCLDNRGPALVTAETVREWLGVEDTRLSVRPVIDLTPEQHSDGYAIPDRIREQVVLRFRTCTFPHCTRPARGCDLDHAIPFDAGGSTSTDNLHPLCRRHHRLKTFGGWHPEIRGPGLVHWRSPAGYEYLRDRDGTTSLTPVAVGSAPD